MQHPTPRPATKASDFQFLIAENSKDRSRGTICPSEWTTSRLSQSRAQATLKGGRRLRPSREGAGKTGCSPHPQPRSQLKKHTGVVATGRGGFNRPSLRNGFNGFLRALLGDRAFLPPSSTQCASIVANLMPASGHQDHTASPSASSASRLYAPPRPPHPAPNVRDDREPSLLGARDSAGDSRDFSSKGSEISLRVMLDTSFAKQPVGQISGTMACGQIALLPMPSDQLSPI
jgi:hypothetical protein